MRAKHLRLVSLVMGLLVLMAGVWSVKAQNPNGIPEVIVTVADDGMTFTPSEINAGITTLAFENVREEAPFEGLIARLKEGVTPEGLMDAIGQGDPIGAFKLAYLYGGAIVPAGTSWSITLDLKPGMHIFADRNAPPAFFNVLASDGEGAEIPEADVTLAFVDFAFGIRSTIDAGEQVWHIQNVGQQFHEAVIIRIDEDTSLEEATALVGTVHGPDGRRNEDSPADLVFLWPPMDPGENAWITLDLEPGRYALGCLLPDLTLLPEMHRALDHGMVRIFRVE